MTAATRIKRVYLPPSADDGFRVLVDRLWPRGLTKAAADVGLWLKDIAPSPALRTWWDHDPARLDEFADRYRHELDTNPAVTTLTGVLDSHPLTTLLYGAHDPHVNHAVVLLQYLADHGIASAAEVTD